MSSNTVDNEAQKTTGTLNSVVGTGEQLAGAVIEKASEITGIGGSGKSVLTKDGETRHDQGEVDIKEAKAEDYASAKSDKVTAKVDNVISTVTGDVTGQEKALAKEKVADAKSEVNKPTS